MARRKVPLIELLASLHPERPSKELFAEILRGGVRVDGETIVKPGTTVPADAAITIRERRRFVSRGGEKLARALDEWRIDCAGRVWIDAGCSTGGFTDCLLSRGAAIVHAVDVGSNQLDWRLRGDPRVRTMERTNVMRLRTADLDPPADRAVADLSFRSLRGAAAHILGLAREGCGIFLVKPQFEWEDPPEEFDGIVRQGSAVREILRSLAGDLQEESVTVVAAMPSPFRGRKGNREFLFLLRRGTRGRPDRLPEILESLVLE